MARRIAFLFPGQGAQAVGMGRDLFGADAFADELIERASKFCGEDLARMCAKGPERLLAKTEFLQPALAAVSIALWKRLTDSGVRPHTSAGHSAGEIPALAAGAMASPGDLVTLAAERGRLMGEAASRVSGGMVAVTGAPVQKLFDAVEPLKKNGVISVAAVNASTQVTVSGDMELLEKLAKSLMGTPGTNVTKLRVSGAWHSEHMRPAVAPLSRILSETKMTEASIPIVFNRDGSEVRDPDDAREHIAEQLVRPVRWDLVMARLFEMKITDFVEIGPGRVLRGLVRLNSRDPSVSVHNVSDLRSLERTVNKLKD